MNIRILTLFPEFLEAFIEHSMIKRAVEQEILHISLINPRDFSHNKHNQVDDTPYGGGEGMLMMAPPIFEAFESIPKEAHSRRRVILMAPTGQPFTQDKAKELASYDELIFICGHYEGIDYRVEEALVDEAISIGDYVLTGGEIPAMVVADAVARMIPGVLGTPGSAMHDSFYEPLLECPHYTKPREYRSMAVPEVLLSGHHENIRKWRLEESLKRTLSERPDLLERLLSAEEEDILQRLGYDKLNHKEEGKR